MTGTAQTSSSADELNLTVQACGKPDTITHPGPQKQTLFYRWNRLSIHFASDGEGPGFHWTGAEIGRKSLLTRPDLSDAFPCFKSVWMKSAEAVPPLQAKPTPDAAEGMVFGTAWVCMLIFAVMAYFLPCLIASSRGVTYRTGIILVNLFFGWTVIGWIVTVVWASTAETEAQAKAKEFDYDKLAAAITARNPPEH